MSVVRHMFNGFFGTQKTMVKSISKFEPRKGQVQVKLGQIRSNFKIQNFFKNMPILSSFVTGFQKCDLFLRTSNRNAKNCISKKWRHHLYLFIFTTAQPNIKINASKFSMCVVCKYFDDIFSVFWWLQKVGFYRHLFFEKLTFWVLWVKIENI